MSCEVRGRASAQRPPTDTAKRLGDTAVVLAFVPLKRRGRPRKPLAVDRRCNDEFDAVATVVAGIARQKDLWGATRERVRHRADRDPVLRPVSNKVLGFRLEHLNRKVGFDWHAADTIAADLGVTTRSVENAFSELTDGRLSAPRAGAHQKPRQGDTALAHDDPRSDPAAREVSRERETMARERLGRLSARAGPSKSMTVEPNKKAGGPEQQRRNGPEHLFGQTLKREPPNESVGSADDDFDQQQIVEPAEGKKGRQEEAEAEACPGIERTAGELRPKTPMRNS